MDKENVFYGFEESDYLETVEMREMSVENVFELFNGVVSAIEEENNARTVLCRVHDGLLPFDAKMTVEFVERYDEFINDSDFETDCFEVGKIEMENFWASINRKNDYRIVSRQETYGKSTIYEFARGKRSIGYLLNNMTYDGQNMYVLTSVKYSASVRNAFKGTGRYPVFMNGENGKMNRWTRVINYLDSVGATAINAWSVLETEDSKFFYAELKKHNVWTDSDKQLLKSIRSYGFTRSFDCIVEDLENELKEMETEMEELEETIAYANVSIENLFSRQELDRTDISEVVSALIETVNDAIVELKSVENEYGELKNKYLDLTEENNAMDVETTIDDYDVPVDLMEKYN
jgi:hypothetical protein